MIKEMIKHITVKSVYKHQHHTEREAG